MLNPYTYTHTQFMLDLKVHGLLKQVPYFKWDARV